MLVAVLVVVAAAASPICNAVRGFLQDVDVPDGLSGLALQGLLDWGRGLCATNPDQIDTSRTQTVDLSQLYLNFPLPPSYRVDLATMTYRLHASVSNDQSLSFLATLEFSFPIFKSSTLVTSVTGSITKKVDGMPLQSASEMPRMWEGTISSTPNNELFIGDQDMFDGTPAAVLLSPSSENIPSLIEVMREVVDYGFNINRRARSVDIAAGPFNNSLRGIFTTPDPLKISPTMTGQLWPEGTSGLLTQFRVVCSAEACDPQRIALQSHMNTVCKGSMVWTNFVITGDVFISHDSNSIQIRGLRATSQGFQSCSTGFVGTQITTQGGSPVWPLSLFLEDMQAKIGMVRASPLSSTGNVFATLTQGPALLSSVRSNIFGTGGFLFPDRPLTPAVISALATSLSRLPSTMQTHSLIQDTISAVVSDVNAVATLYSAQAMAPTLLGFLQFWASAHPTTVRLVPAENAMFLTLFSSTVRSDALPRTDPAVLMAAKSLSTWVPMLTLDSCRPLSTTFRGMVSGSFIIQLGDNTFPATQQDVQWGGTAQLTCNIIAGIRARTVFDYSTSAQTFIAEIQGKRYTVVGDKVSEDWTTTNLEDRYRTTIKGFSSISWLNDEIPNIKPNLGLLNSGLSLVQVINISTWTTSSVIQASEAIMDYALSTSLVGGDFVIPQVIASENNMKFSVSFYSIKDVRVKEAANWNFVSLSEVSMPTVVKVILNVDVIAQQPNAAMVARPQSRLWTAPVRYRMVSVPMTSGQLKLNIALPDEASFKLQLTFKDRGLESATVQSELLNNNQLATVTFSPEIPEMLSPATVLAAVQQGLFSSTSSILSGPLNATLPPLLTPLGNIIVNPIPFDHLGWLSQPGSDSRLLSTNIDFNSHLPIEVNLTVNKNIFCMIHQGAPRDLTEATTFLTQGISACGLSSFLGVASIPGQALTTGEEATTGFITLNSTVPGLVWQLQASCSSTSIPLSGMFALQYMAGFTDYDDLSRMLTAFGSPYKPPQWKQMDSNPMFIPAELSDVYPNVFTALFLPFSVEGRTTTNSVDLQPRIELENLNVSLNQPTVFSTVHVNFKTQIGVVFGIPPPSFTLSTNFGGGISEGTVIHAPNNTFTLRIVVEQRSPDKSVSSKSLVEPITIPDGMTTGYALQTYFPSVISAAARSLLNITRAPGIPQFDQLDQYLIGVKRARQSDGTWLIPTLISIEESHLPGLANTTVSLPTFQFVSSGFQFGAQLEVDATGSSVDGLLGAFSVHADGWSMHTHYNLAVNQDQPLELLVNLATSLRQETGALAVAVELGGGINISLDGLTPAINFGSLQHLDASRFPKLPHLNISSILESTRLNSFPELDNITKELQAMEQSFVSLDESTSKLFHQLAAVNMTTLCDGFHNVVALADTIDAQPWAGKAFPFVDKLPKEIFEDLIGGKLRKSYEAVCVNLKAESLTRFCDGLQQIFGHPVCKNIALNETSLDVDLELVEEKKSYNQEVTLDLARYLKNTQLPIAATGSSSLELLASGGMMMHLHVDWKSGALIPQFALLRGSCFDVKVGAHASGSLQGHMGPLPVDFASHQVNFSAQLHLCVDKVNFEGAANFFSKFSALSKWLGDVKVTISDLRRFLLDFSCDVSTPYNVNAPCHVDAPDFVPNLLNALSELNLLDIFSDSKWFISQLDKAIGLALKDIYKLLRNLVRIPLIKVEIQKAIDHIFGFFKDPSRLKAFMENITDWTFQKRKLPYTNSTLVDIDVLKVVRELLCKVFVIDSCPSPPAWSRETFRFPIKKSEQIAIPIKNLTCDLRGGTVFALDLQCKSDLKVNYTIKFDLVVAYTKGLTVEFPDRPFNSTVALSVEKGCDAWVQFGFIGGDFAFDGSKVGGEINITHKNEVWDVQVQTNALLKAVMSFGFAGRVKNDAQKSKELFAALPTIRTSGVFRFYYSSVTNLHTTSFNFTDPKLCMGQFLNKLLHPLTEKLNKLLQQFNDVFGEKGLLMKRLPPTKILLGREMTVAELAIYVESHLCSSCRTEKLQEAIDTFRKIQSVLKKLNALTTEFSCDDSFQKAQNFTIDFDNFDIAKLQPHGDIPDPTISFAPQIPPAAKAQVVELYKMTTEGEFSLKMLIHQGDIPKLLLAMILDQPMALVECTMPTAKFDFHFLHFEAVVWTPPIITAAIDLDGALVATIPPIVYTTTAFTALIKTGQPRALLQGIALRTLDSRGDPIQFLKGSIRLTTSLSIYWFFINVQLSAFIEASFGAIIRAPTGLLTWDELLNLFGRNNQCALEILILIDVGLGMEVSACIKICVWECWSVCWRLFHEQWKFNIFSQRIMLIAPKPITDRDGRLDLSPDSIFMAGNGLPTFIITSRGSQERAVLATSAIDIATPGRSSTTPTPAVLDTFGLHPDARFEMFVMTSKQLVRFPYTLNGVLRLSQVAQPTADFMLTSTYLAAQGAPGVEFTAGGCLSVIADQPQSFSDWSISGTPCPLSVRSDSTYSFTMGGLLKDYLGPIELDGANNIDVQIPETRYSLDTSTITVANKLVITTKDPSNVEELQVTSHPSLASLIEVGAIPSGRTVTCTGGTGWDEFRIKDLGALDGLVTLEGNLGQNTMKVNLHTPPGGLLAIATSSSLISASHTLVFNHIQRQYYTVYSAPGELSQFEISHVGTGTVVNLTVHGVPTSNNIINVSGCDDSGHAPVILEGEGEFLVHIGLAGKVLKAVCVIQIIGQSAGQINSIIIDARSEDKHLEVEMNNGRLQVWDRFDSSRSLTVIHQDIQLIKVLLSEQTSAHIAHKGNSAGTEVSYILPDKQPSSTASTAVICRTVGAVAIVGAVATTHVANVPSVCETGTTPHPLQNLKAPLIVLGSKDGGVGDIIVSSGTDASQAFKMDNSCLHQVENRVIVNPPVSLTSRMQSILEEYGWNGRSCSLGYLPRHHIFVTTGSGQDQFEAVGSTALAVTVDLGAGEDILTLDNTVATKVQASVGVGADVVIIRTPITDSYIDLGLDQDKDEMDIQQGSYIPGVRKNIVGPLGPHDAAVEFGNYLPQDLLFIHGSGSSPHRVLTGHGITSTSVPILLAAGQKVSMQMVNNTDYALLEAATGAVLVISAQKTDSPAAHDASLTVQVPDLAATVVVHLSSERGLNTVLNWILASQSNRYSIFADQTGITGVGLVRIGAVQSDLVAVDHISISTKSEVDVHVSALPCDADFMLIAPSTSMLDVKSATNNVLSVGADIFLPETCLSWGVTIVAVGEKSTVHSPLQAQYVKCNDGCATAETPTGATAPSKWFQDQLHANQVRSWWTIGPLCSLYMSRLGTWDLTASFLWLADGDRNRNFANLLLGEANLFLTDSVVWSTARTTHRDLVVDGGRFSVKVDAGRQANLDVTFSSSQDVLQFGCTQDLGTDQKVSWYFVCLLDNSPGFWFLSSFCDVHVCPNGVAPVPLINISAIEDPRPVSLETFHSVDAFIAGPPWALQLYLPGLNEIPVQLFVQDPETVDTETHLILPQQQIETSKRPSPIVLNTQATDANTATISFGPQNIVIHQPRHMIMDLAEDFDASVQGTGNADMVLRSLPSDSTSSTIHISRLENNLAIVSDASTIIEAGLIGSNKSAIAVTGPNASVTIGTHAEPLSVEEGCARYGTGAPVVPSAWWLQQLVSAKFPTKPTQCSLHFYSIAELSVGATHFNLTDVDRSRDSKKFILRGGNVNLSDSKQWGVVTIDNRDLITEHLAFRVDENRSVQLIVPLTTTSKLDVLGCSAHVNWQFVRNHSLVLPSPLFTWSTTTVGCSGSVQAPIPRARFSKASNLTLGIRMEEDTKRSLELGEATIKASRKTQLAEVLLDVNWQGSSLTAVNIDIINGETEISVVSPQPSTFVNVENSRFTLTVPAGKTVSLPNQGLLFGKNHRRTFETSSTILSGCIDPRIMWSDNPKFWDRVPLNGPDYCAEASSDSSPCIAGSVALKMQISNALELSCPTQTSISANATSFLPLGSSSDPITISMWFFFVAACILSATNWINNSRKSADLLWVFIVMLPFYASQNSDLTGIRQIVNAVEFCALTLGTGWGCSARKVLSINVGLVLSLSFAILFLVLLCWAMKSKNGNHKRMKLTLLWASAALVFVSLPFLLYRQHLPLAIASLVAEGLLFCGLNYYLLNLGDKADGLRTKVKVAWQLLKVLPFFLAIIFRELSTSSFADIQWSLMLSFIVIICVTQTVGLIVSDFIKPPPSKIRLACSVLHIIVLAGHMSCVIALYALHKKANSRTVLGLSFGALGCAFFVALLSLLPHCEKTLFDMEESLPGQASSKSVNGDAEH